MDLLGEENNGAEFSTCGKYRYALWRIWDKQKGLIMFIGLNPSTANKTDNDPTIRRVIRFAKDLGYGGVYMCNLFPYVSTNPDDMIEVSESEIEKNDIQIMTIAGNHCIDIIFAWGNFNVAIERGKDIAEMFPHAKALAINKNGSPKHPLYVKADIKPVFYNIKK